jgi:D-xylose 1-dehydrogenase (NADP+, D-xylono-1,5-lactone-forming)
MTDIAPVRWGVLGTADITERVVPAMAKSELTDVVAIASRTQKRAETTARALGVPRAYPSYSELLADPDIEAVYIPLPNFLHLEWVLAAAAAGKHILCEKPMAITADDATMMVQAARDADVVLAEAFMYGNHPRYDRLHEIVRSGEIGDVRTISGTFTFDASDEVNATAFAGHRGGGAVYDVGCYVMHAARHLLGTEPLAVTANAQVSADHGGIDMMTSALVEFPADVSLLLQCGMWAADEDTLRVLGSRGRIDIPSAFFAVPGRDGFSVLVGDNLRYEPVPSVDHYTLQADMVGRAVRLGSPTRYTAEDPILGATALEACIDSLRTHQRIEIVPHSIAR